MYPPTVSGKDVQRELSFAAPSAPPYPPPPSQCSNMGEPIIDTGIASNFPPTSATPNVPRTPVAWSTGLWDCFNDINSCCLTWWCPCITFGRIAEIVDRGSTSCGVSGAMYILIMWLTGCSCIYSCFYRAKLRGQYFLEEKPCPDCCVHYCCEGCALCQEYRELTNRGFDMSIGWHGNMERQRRLLAMAPIVEGGMTR
ncbi:hypothetical protein JCGZ_18304 [Jatropha curcas]|uniref:Uncharacterized protein n=2 Tax=Jatropha curcas TaxID=180498 RepID=A0A067K2W7_JATCU|nr:hypothetical protein JCGZ_18304 [Jatropha curcas]